MAKSYVTYSCGHSGQIGAYNRRECDRLADRAATQLCPDCYGAERQKQHDAENAKAATAATAAGLPQLVGSEKQVAWANTIRLAKIEEARKYVEFVERRESATDVVPRADAERLGLTIRRDDGSGDVQVELSADQMATRKQQFRDGFARLQVETDTKFWIDRRNDSGGNLIRHFVRQALAVLA